jgi:hypothetical protein
MIDINKTYRTRDGREVRIYAVDGLDTHSVHGAIYVTGGWLSCTWRKDGRFFADIDQEADLIEVKPRIQRTVWLNIYEREDRPRTKKEADEHAFDTRLACVKVEIDCEEGHGL